MKAVHILLSEHLNFQYIVFVTTLFKQSLQIIVFFVHCAPPPSSKNVKEETTPALKMTNKYIVWILLYQNISNGCARQDTLSVVDESNAPFS